MRSLAFLFFLACSSERPAPVPEAAPASPPAPAPAPAPIIAAAPARYLTAHVTLDAAGKPARVEITRNTVKRDPKLVADCVEKDLATWTFAPPGDAPPEFDMTLLFSDAC